MQWRDEEETISMSVSMVTYYLMYANIHVHRILIRNLIELCTLLPEKLLDSAPTSSNVMSVSSGQVGANGRAINKGTILKLSVDHIKELREDVNKYQERIRELEHMIECAKRGEMIIDPKANLQNNTFDANHNTARGGHQRVGSIQFRQQFNNLQLGPE